MHKAVVLATAIAIAMLATEATASIANNSTNATATPSVKEMPAANAATPAKVYDPFGLSEVRTPFQALSKMILVMQITQKIPPAELRAVLDPVALAELQAVNAGCLESPPQVDAPVDNGAPYPGGTHIRYDCTEYLAILGLHTGVWVERLNCYGDGCLGSAG